MEKVQMTLNEKIKKNLEKDYNEALKDANFKNLVNNLKIATHLGMQNTSKLKDSVEELKNCKNCKNLAMCHNKVNGYVFFPKVNEGKLQFDYVPCKYQKELIKKQEEKKESLNEIEKARMKDIYVNDKNRVAIIKWLKTFYDNYEKVNTLKGLYLHGSFGSGKTFLIAALLNELALKKNAYVAIAYFPEVIRQMKEDFSLINDRINYYSNVDILLIDDIGAENVTNWSRDEILGTILQYRMNNKLTTFFTSNLTIAELEKHLALTKGSIDTVKARRIIERIEQLTIDMELVSPNLRK